MATPTKYESDGSDIELVVPSNMSPPSVQIACNEPSKSESSIHNPPTAIPNSDNQLVSTECDTRVEPRSESGSEILSDSIMLTPPPESDTVHPTLSNSNVPAPMSTVTDTDLSVDRPSVEPHSIDGTVTQIPVNAHLSMANIDPITPTETPPNEAESPLPYSSPPPLISVSGHSKRKVASSKASTDIESGAVELGSKVKDDLPTLKIPLSVLSPKAFVASSTILGSAASLSSAPSKFELFGKVIIEQNYQRGVECSQKDASTSDLLKRGEEVTISARQVVAATSSEVDDEIIPQSEVTDVSVIPTPGSPSVVNVQNEEECSTLALDSRLQSKDVGSSVDRDSPKDETDMKFDDKIKCEDDTVVEAEKKDFVSGTITVDQLEKASSPTLVPGEGPCEVEGTQLSPGLVSSLLAGDVSGSDGGGSSDEWDESLLPPRCVCVCVWGGGGGGVVIGGVGFLCCF